VAKPTVAAKIHEPLDIHRNFGPQRSLDFIFAVDDFSNTVYFTVGQIVRLDIRIDIELRQNPVGRCSADAIDIRKAYFNAFTSR